ncbi:hypothetical protein GCM10010124_31810 [Pilimelia terevasa]|uniref:Bacterial transcriptional activator domain-containing protein n=1 Tax=Pilimelia terevasa TaxID=53372 RepID=A0A8J3FJE2_9ACTN|nr:BTAD domain-containing putative transcriptional regulator [Pilimelia terevasa]GGK36792.1 hypothetical protein GCM10010124_31810 [Pilimelia terevasa]
MLTRILKAVAAVAAMAAILLGIPAALLTLGTNPVAAAAWAGEHLWEVDHSNIVLLGAITLTGWIAWLTLLQAFTAALLDHLRPGVRARPAIGVQRAMFTFLLGAVLTTATAGSWASAATPPVLPDRPAVAAIHDATPPAATDAHRPVLVHQGPGAGRSDMHVHTVQRGEHLLDVAERYYGSAEAYPRIVAANSGVTQPDGRSLQHCQTLIRQGWQLRIPQPTHGLDNPTDTSTDRVEPGTVTLVANQQSYDVTVGPGDNLYKLAQRWLGDGDRWPEIYKLNKHRHFADGRTLHTPRLIHPGWTLDLPGDARPPAGTKPKPPTPPSEPTPPREPGPTTPPPRAGPTGPATPTPTAPNSDDGVVTPTSGDQRPTGTPAGPQRPSTPATPAPARGIDLPGGSWVDVGLAAALTAAGVLVWAHRRRRYRPGHGHGVDRRDHDLKPLPAMLRYLRVRLVPTSDSTAAAAVAEPIEDWVEDLKPDTGGQHHHHDEDDGLDLAGQARTPDVDADPDTDDEAEETDPQPVQVGDAQPVVPAITGEHADLWPTAGLGLTGPGAHAAARGMLVAALASGTIELLHSRTQVIITAATLASLLGAAAVRVPESSRLLVTAGLEEALAELEAHALCRARLCQEHDTFSIGDLRDGDNPHVEDLPPLLLITDVGPATEQTRIAWSLSHHHRLDTHGILLGGWTHGDTVEVAADGTTTRASRPGLVERHRHGHSADLGRLTVLDTDQTLAMLITLAEAHNGQPAPDPHPEAPAVPTQPAVDPADTGGTHDEPSQTTSDARVNGHHVTPPAATTLDRLPPEPASNEETDAGDIESEPCADNTVTDAVEDSGTGFDGKIRILLLGRPTLPDNDRPGMLGGRGLALELLAYLAVNDGQASVDAIFEDLVPDKTFPRARQAINKALSLLRRALSDIGDGGDYVGRQGRHIALHTDRLDIDVLRLRSHLAKAKTANTGVARARHLRQALAAYGGTFADGEKWPWLAIPREAVHRDYIDAVLALAQELSAQPAEALTVLEPVIAAQPHAEVLYQEAMRAHAALGDDDGIRATRRRLTQALEDIDVEPNDDTTDLAARLLAEVARRAGRSRRDETR